MQPPFFTSTLNVLRESARFGDRKGRCLKEEKKKIAHFTLLMSRNRGAGPDVGHSTFTRALRRKRGALTGKQ